MDAASLLRLVYRAWVRGALGALAFTETLERIASDHE